jgi:hypothetical protein
MNSNEVLSFALGTLLKRFNEQQGGDLFWINAPKEMLIDLINLMNDTEENYSISDYLNLLLCPQKQLEKSKFTLEKFLRHSSYKKVLERHKRLVERIESPEVTCANHFYPQLVACANQELNLIRCS